MAKKFISFVLLFLAVIGTIGGVGYACFCKAYYVAIGIAALVYLAWPKIRECFTNLTE